MKGAEVWSLLTLQQSTLFNLRRVISQAHSRTTGYKQLYDSANFDPSTFRTFEDLRQVPFVTKETIRDNLDAFTIARPDNQYIATSGSTGIPLGIYRTDVSFARDLASKAYFYHLWGWSEEDRCIRLRGETIDTPDHTQLREEFNELRLSSYHLTSEVMEHYYQKVLEYDPLWLKCYPSTGFMFARWLKENNKTLKLKGVFCASEKLYPYQRRMMARTFKCRVKSHYGHYEGAVLAAHCERAPYYHVLPHYGYAELLDKDNNPVTERGQRGEIVATSFINQATLFIRYRTGDHATYLGDKCPICERPYQIWRDIDGRLAEFIIARDGSYIPLTGLRFPDNIFNHVLQFQFRQSVPGEVTLCIVPRESCTEGILKRMRGGVQSELGEIATITIREVESIERTDRAKQRLLIREGELG
jgi:phenylacetate-CoA ligase